MADFEYPVTAATAPNSFPIADTGITGIAATAVVPVVVRLAPAMALVHTGTQTQATIAAAMLRYLRARGYAREGGGGVKVAALDGQNAATLTEVAAAD
jgi:hypothetical protein